MSSNFLTLLARCRDSFVFQDKTALTIVEEIFKDHPQAHYRIEVNAALRVRSLCTQYRVKVPRTHLAPSMTAC